MAESTSLHDSRTVLGELIYILPIYSFIAAAFFLTINLVACIARIIESDGDP